MAYTLTQARGLLTAAELAIFDQSRAGPIKELTAARLRAKVERARALRDKYRDLYRRQSVATRSAPASRRSAAGGDNERTQKKATVFTEVLERFETRLAQLDAKADVKLKPAVRTAARTTVKAPVKPPVRAPAKKTAARTPVKKASATPTPAKKARKPKAKVVSLKSAVKHALELKQASLAAPPVAEHSSKAPAALSPLGAAAAGAPQVTAPLDINPRAARLNPLKERAENIALHAHAGSQNRHAQGKRDAR
ncbi:hypothetical protein [Variovorax paradoxus]|uniref:Uncharacterized protein n=1 Tax=Variovorax paradoxus TaxID=34073 RepID=A0A679JVP4_VARPD|nr:hypothetical protein VVAX_06604 [Variovorax paradoxus]